MNYMDDINGGMESYEQLESALIALLDMAIANNMKLKPSKTKVGYKTANVGGFEIGNGERKLSNKHMDPLRNIRPPTNIHVSWY